MNQFQADDVTKILQKSSQNELKLDDKRSSHRQRVIKSGTIYFNKGYASFQCRVRNLNEKGALLEFGETTGIPSHFQFQSGDSVEQKDARLVWRGSQKIGVQFS